MFCLQTEGVITFHNKIFNDCFCMENIKKIEQTEENENDVYNFDIENYINNL